MKLESIGIKNYRSVETINIDLKPINDESYTYGLIGVNEAGKSSILKGIALTDNFKSINITLKDFYIKSNPILCEYLYSLEDKEIDELLLLTTELIDKKDLVFENFRKLKLQFSFLPSDFLKPQIFAVFTLAKGNINFALNPGTEVLQFFKNKTHKTIFWTADEKHLITNTISLASFASDPDSISIPLRNCFKLAGITNIQERIDLLDDSTERESLREELGIKVTKHIKRVWPKHPIKITFDISNGNIHFHVKDDDVIGKSKTADQRSDGFRQFISFLLTLSAENINSELKNTIILLDEPETHLHPRAQEDLLKELIAITKGDNNNIVFFATHSNYMIDKTFLSRNYKITKPKDKTLIDKFDEKQSSYASVNYDVFEIVSTDYHNELFGKAQEISGIENGTEFDKKIKEIIENCPKKNYQHSKGAKFECSLPTYIRHQIHHPENDKNQKFTESELEKSIKILLDFITKLKALK